MTTTTPQHLSTSDALRHPGVTVWLTGLPSAGKSTIARELAGLLAGESRRVEILDGDTVREHLTADLGFSRADRDTNVRRIGWVARMLARNGVVVLVPVIAPFAQTRDLVREEHTADGVPYLLVHVATAVAVCAERDVKGLYARQRAGQITGLTGVDDPYELPADPDLRLDTSGSSVEESAASVRRLLVERGLHR